MIDIKSALAVVEGMIIGFLILRGLTYFLKCVNEILEINIQRLETIDTFQEEDYNAMKLFCLCVNLIEDNVWNQCQLSYGTKIYLRLIAFIPIMFRRQACDLKYIRLLAKFKIVSPLQDETTVQVIAYCHKLLETSPDIFQRLRRIAMYVPDASETEIKNLYIVLRNQLPEDLCDSLMAIEKSTDVSSAMLQYIKETEGLLKLIK